MAARAAIAVVGVALAIGVLAATGMPHANAVVALPETVIVPSAVAAAVSAAQQNGDRVAVAVLDTVGNTFYGAGDVDGDFVSESIVKVVIAANLLVTHQLTDTNEQLLFDMISQSDDAAADALWGVVGGPAVVSWAASRYGITNLGSPPTQWGWWGNTKFTARGLVELYAALKADPAVGPWLITAMSQMSPIAADGTDQRFGLALQTSSAALKQGWGDDDDDSNSQDLNSTGFLDANRYAVVVFAEHVPAETMSELLPTINALAAAVAPGALVAEQPRVVATAPRSVVAAVPTSSARTSILRPVSPPSTSGESATTNAASADTPTALIHPGSGKHVDATKIRVHELSLLSVVATVSGGVVFAVLAGKHGCRRRVAGARRRH